MTSEDQQAILQALTTIGLTIERPVMEAGSRRGVEPISLTSIVGEWTRRGWIVSVGQPRDRNAGRATHGQMLHHLQLVREVPVATAVTEGSTT